MIYCARRGHCLRDSLHGLVIPAVLIASACGTTSSESVTGPDAPKCSVTLIAPSDSIAGEGGAGSVTVTTQPECAWKAVAEASWITNLIPSQGQGNAEVRFQIGQNPGASARESAIVVNNQRAIVRQSSFTCQFGVGASDTQFAAAGGTGTITITSSEGCAWTASSDVSWIVIARSGTGSGSVSFTVAPNTGAARTGTVFVGDASIAIVQAGLAVAPPPTCTVTPQPVSINPTSRSVTAAGGIVNVAVSTAAGCPWGATSNASFITITAGASGSGNGTVTLSVAQNTGGARTGTATIGGQTFTVNQACPALISPTSRDVGAGAYTEQTVVVTTISGCTWTATSHASWLTITSGAGGNGSGHVTFAVAANSGSMRTGSLTIADQTLTVTQAGP